MGRRAVEVAADVPVDAVEAIDVVARHCGCVGLGERNENADDDEHAAKRAERWYFML